MGKRNSITAFFTYTSCVIAYFIVVFANALFLEEYLAGENINFTEYDQIEIFKIYGYITAAVILLILIRFFAYKKLIICGFIFYYLSIFNIVFMELSHEMTLYYFLIYATSISMLPILILGYHFCDKQIGVNYSLALYSCSVLVAYVLVETFEYFSVHYNVTHSITELLLANVIPLGVFIALLIISPVYSTPSITDQYRFFAVVKNMEIEMLVGFSVFYVIMAVANGYEVYALTESLPSLQINFSYNLLFALIAFTLLITPSYIFRLNKHKVSIVCISVISISYAVLPYWGKYNLYAISIWFLIAVLMYVILSCSLISLAEKFQDVNLFSSLSIYTLTCALGFYCGFITIDTVENTLGKNGFLISICFVLFELLLYYIYIFYKNKLYRR